MRIDLQERDVVKEERTGPKKQGGKGQRMHPNEGTDGAGDSHRAQCDEADRIKSIM